MILRGKYLSQSIVQRVAKQIDPTAPPHLVVILVGSNPASQSYVKVKRNKAAQAGFRFSLKELPSTVAEQKLQNLITDLNKDPDVDGILLQLPIPHQLDASKCLSLIDPSKDVDGLSPFNQGLLFSLIERQIKGWSKYLFPCAAKAVLYLIEDAGIQLSGKEVCLVGYGQLTNKPLAHLLAIHGATVTICNACTPDLAQKAVQADIIVSAVGEPSLIGPEHVKKGAAVFDVGFSRKEGEIIGDVQFEKVKEKAGLITPVPGGVGPVTVACLLENVLLARDFNYSPERNF